MVITTKLAAAILGGRCSDEVFCRPSTAPVLPPLSTLKHRIAYRIWRSTNVYIQRCRHHFQSRGWGISSRAERV